MILGTIHQTERAARSAVEPSDGKKNGGIVADSPASVFEEPLELHTQAELQVAHTVVGYAAGRTTQPGDLAVIA